MHLFRSTLLPLTIFVAAMTCWMQFQDPFIRFCLLFAVLGGIFLLFRVRLRYCRMKLGGHRLYLLLCVIAGSSALTILLVHRVLYPYLNEFPLYIVLKIAGPFILFFTWRSYYRYLFKIAQQEKKSAAVNRRIS